MTVGLIVAVAVALAGLGLGWRTRRLYLALYEDAEVPRRQLEQLSRRREALMSRLDTDHTVSPDAAHTASPDAAPTASPTASEATAAEGPANAVESVRADLDDVIHRIGAAERVRALTLEIYARRVTPLRARCLWLPRPHR